MGRARIPLDMQKGNLTVDQKLKMQQAEGVVTVGREQLSRPPNWLVDKLAKQEFKRIVKEFEKVNVVGNLDLNNIAGYCNAYAFYRRVTKELESVPITKEIEIDEEIDGLKVKKKAQSMSELYRGLCKNQRDFADEMRKFAALCGLTIDSRLKVGTAQVSENDGKIEKDFGDI